MTSELSGKVALVTGAARGIGRAVATALAERGASVIVNDLPRTPDLRTPDLRTPDLRTPDLRTPDAETAALVESLSRWGGRARFIGADVSSYEQVCRMRDEVLEAYGGLDILVNNAGITRDALLTRMSVEEWHAVINVNLHGVFYCCKAFADALIARGGGSGGSGSGGGGARIINISSVVGEAGNIGQANYAAAKAGVIGLTKALALELARYGVTVNAVAPGFTATEMVAAIPEKVKEKLVARIPAGRMGEPEEIAAAVAYLASPRAQYVTGHVLSVNGGFYL